MNENINLNQTKDKTLTIEEMLVKEAIKNIGNPFKNLTVKDVAKDLLVSEATANSIFRRNDFPSVNIGKTKTVTLLAYLVWKMNRKERKEDNNEKTK